jgi:hypothetical protein
MVSGLERVRFDKPVSSPSQFVNKISISLFLYKD